MQFQEAIQLRFPTVYKPIRVRNANAHLHML